MVFTVSFDSTETQHRTILKPNNIVALRGNQLPQATDLLSDKDRDYFITYPGDLYRLRFPVDTVGEGMKRTYFLSSRGYYVEWLRMSWIEDNGSYGPKQALIFNDALLQRTARRWLAKRDSMESQFYSTRLPLDR